MGSNIDLDKVALEIARKHLLEKVSFQELGKQYYASPSTIQRRLIKWLEENRFELTDRLLSDHPVVVTRDDRLGEELVKQTGIWRARVVRISGIESEDGTASDVSISGDELHRCLGNVAAELVINSLRRSMVIGIASGRGVGCTIDGIRAIADKTPSWASGYESIRLVSMCGGAHLGGWENNTTGRDFDADENVFALSSILKSPRQNVFYMNSPILTDSKSKGVKTDPKFSIDTAIIGIGRLTADHHYFRDHTDMQLRALTEPIRKITDWQKENPEYSNSVAEIVLRLYPENGREFPPELPAIIEDTNNHVLSIGTEKLRNAGEVILVAGGTDKAGVLRRVLTGAYTDAPIDRNNLTLVTDAITAEAILQK